MKSLAHPRPVLSVAYAPDGGMLFTGDAGGTVRAWNLLTGDSCVVVQDTKGVPSPVVSLAVSRDGRWLAVGCGQALLCRIWELPLDSDNPDALPTGGSFGRWLYPLGWGFTNIGASPDDLTFSPDSELLVCLVWPRLSLWHVSRSQVEQTLGEDLLLSAPTFAPRGNRLAVLAKGDGGYSVLLWSYTARKVRALAAAGCDSRPLFSPDGRWLAVSGVSAVEVRNRAARMQQALPNPTGKHVRLMAFSPDGNRLLTGTREDGVWLWDVLSGKILAEWDWDIGTVNGLAFAPDGMTAAAAGSNRTVLVWDIDP